MPRLLPIEVMSNIIHQVIDTPAAFIFDVEIGELLYPPLVPRGCHIRFRPVVSPPTGDHRGTYESEVSKTIRNLLLTNKDFRAECLRNLHGIQVPTVSRHAIVRFNPDKHIICLNKVDDCLHQVWRIFGPVPPRASYWARQTQHQLIEVDFPIKNLAFVDEGDFTNKQDLIFFRLAFNSIRRIYGALIDMPRENSSEPLSLACPALDPAHTVAPVFSYMARRTLDELLNRIDAVPQSYLAHEWTNTPELELLALT